MSAINEKWWEELYDEYLADVLLENGNKLEAESTANFLQVVLEISKGDMVFDQCCGTGRISVPLAKAGFQVTGVDLIEPYIQAAQSKVQDGCFSVADAFEFVPQKKCAGAFNWWTSFGYAEDDLENVRMLSRAFDSLIPGGKFALDFMNVPGVLRNFQPQTVTRVQNKNKGEIVLIRESQVDVTKGTLLKEWTYFLENGQRIQHHSSVRLYHPQDLKRLFEMAGFVKIHFYGDLDRSPITINSPRCIVVGSKQ